MPVTPPQLLVQQSASLAQALPFPRHCLHCPYVLQINDKQQSASELHPPPTPLQHEASWNCELYWNEPHSELVHEFGSRTPPQLPFAV